MKFGILAIILISVPTALAAGDDNVSNAMKIHSVADATHFLLSLQCRP